MTDSADSKVQNVGTLLKLLGPNVNWANLGLLVVIGWNARDVMNSTFTMVEEAVQTVTTLQTEVVNMKHEVNEIKTKIAPTVDGNSLRVGKLEVLVQQLESDSAKMKACLKEGKRKCDV